MPVEQESDRNERPGEKRLHELTPAEFIPELKSLMKTVGDGINHETLDQHWLADAAFVDALTNPDEWMAAGDHRRTRLSLAMERVYRDLLAGLDNAAPRTMLKALIFFGAAYNIGVAKRPVGKRSTITQINLAAVKHILGGRKDWKEIARRADLYMYEKEGVVISRYSEGLPNSVYQAAYQEGVRLMAEHLINKERQLVAMRQVAETIALDTAGSVQDRSGSGDGTRRTPDDVPAQNGAGPEPVNTPGVETPVVIEDRGWPEGSSADFHQFELECLADLGGTTTIPRRMSVHPSEQGSLIVAPPGFGKIDILIDTLHERSATPGPAHLFINPDIAQGVSTVLKLRDYWRSAAGQRGAVALASDDPSDYVILFDDLDRLPSFRLSDWAAELDTVRYWYATSRVELPELKRHAPAYLATTLSHRVWVYLHHFRPDIADLPEKFRVFEHSLFQEYMLVSEVVRGLVRHWSGRFVPNFMDLGYRLLLDRFARSPRSVRETAKAEELLGSLAVYQYQQIRDWLKDVPDYGQRLGEQLRTGIPRRTVIERLMVTLGEPDSRLLDWLVGIGVLWEPVPGSIAFPSRIIFDSLVYRYQQGQNSLGTPPLVLEMAWRLNDSLATGDFDGALRVLRSMTANWPAHEDSQARRIAAFLELSRTMVQKDLDDPSIVAVARLVFSRFKLLPEGFQRSISNLSNFLLFPGFSGDDLMTDFQRDILRHTRRG